MVSRAVAAGDPWRAEAVRRHEIDAVRTLVRLGWSVLDSGWPDFLCFRPGEIIVVESKSIGSTLRPNQRALLEVLSRVLPVFVIREGRLERFGAVGLGTGTQRAEARMRARANRNPASIYRRKDGRWVASVSMGRRADGGRARKSYYGPTREAVEAWANAE